MSTLDEPIWSRCSIALIYPARSHFQHTQVGKDGGRFRMNVVAQQKKEENEKTWRGKKKAEERRQVTDFKEATCYPSAVVQGAARQKWFKMVCARVTGTLGKANSHFDPTQTRSGTAPPC